MELTRWHPAKGETGVAGRFAYFDHLDVPASLVADEERHNRIVVLYTKIVGTEGNAPPTKVRPDNKAELIRRFPDAWAEFNGAAAGPVVGTPLSQPFGDLTLTPEKAMNFQIQGITSWEQIRSLSDALCERLGFGTRKLRNDVMVASGMTPPGKPPIAPIAPRFIAAADDPAVPAPGPVDPAESPKSFSPVPGIDMSDPEVAAAAIAAMQAVLQARNKPLEGAAHTGPRTIYDVRSEVERRRDEEREAHKEPVGATVEVSVGAVSSTAAPELETPSPQAAPEAPAGKKRGGWPRGAKRGPDGRPMIEAT